MEGIAIQPSDDNRTPDSALSASDLSAGESRGSSLNQNVAGRSPGDSNDPLTIKPFPAWTESAAGTVYVRAAWADDSPSRARAQIIRFDPNTGDWQPLFSWGTHLCLSPDGKSLAFRGTHPRSKERGTWTCNWRGKHLERVTHVAGPTTWLRHREQLVIADRLFEMRDGRWERAGKLEGSFVASENSGTPADWDVFQLDCSADGKWFVRSWNDFGDSGRHRITISRGLNGEQTLLHEGKNTVANLRLSPNAEKIAFIISNGHRASLQTMDRTSKQLRNLHSTAGDLSAHPTCFSWSPDSKKLLVALVDWVSKASGLESGDVPFLAPVPEANSRLMVYDVDTDTSSPVTLSGIKLLALESLNWVAPIEN